MLAKISIEGNADLAINSFIFVCGHCGHHDTSGATIEFNFRDKKIFYLCSKCSKTNELNFGNMGSFVPLPKTKFAK